MKLPKRIGGIEIHDAWMNKEKLLKDELRFTTIVPQRVYLSMSQNVGAPCEPVVKEGDTVAIGQLVGDTDEAVGAPVHASVSGTVVAVEEWPQSKGGKAKTVIIENDEKNTLSDDIRPNTDAGELSPAEIREKIRQAGIVGMGGATFPTAVKLDTEEGQVDVCILNGSESEPGFSCDNALMVYQSNRVTQGLRIVMRATGAEKGFAGIEPNKPKALEAMRRAFGSFMDLTVEELPALYPEGGEKQIIYTLTGREVPIGGLPSDAGVVVLNVATASAIADAVYDNMPLVKRMCTVTGDVGYPQNVEFPIGTRIRDLIDFCGGFRGVPSKVIAGGPMMGKTVEELDSPLEKGSNGVLVMGQEHDKSYEESPCIRCNRCVDVCPMALVPWAIDRYWRKEDMDAYKYFQAESCINCGCCTYICPATRRLAEKITEAKNKLGEGENG